MQFSKTLLLGRTFVSDFYDRMSATRTIEAVLLLIVRAAASSTMGVGGWGGWFRGPIGRHLVRDSRPNAIWMRAGVLLMFSLFCFIGH